MMPVRLTLLLGGALLAAPPLRAAPALAEGLQACAALSNPSERLACYDQLAGRASASAPVPSSREGSVPSPPSASAPSFGLYKEEHPTAQLSPALRAKVLSIGSTLNGHPTLALEGDQLWEIERADPLLALGDVVSIRRGALGSFTLTTAQGRSYKAKRLR